MEMLKDFTAEQKARLARLRTGLAAYAWCLLRNPVDLIGAAEDAKRFEQSAPNVRRVLLAAVAAGTTVDAAWASELAPYGGLTSEYVDVIARLSFWGKVPTVPVPFLKKVLV